MLNLFSYLRNPRTIILVPKRIKYRVLSLTKPWVLNFAVKSPRNASFYYWLFSKQFDREHFSVLVGKLSHLNKEIDSLANTSQLRRSLHMIEKGLITKPRKAVWAEGYINETIKALKDELNLNCLNTTHRWAFDVLNEYFEQIVPTKITNTAKVDFEAIRLNYPMDSDESVLHIPYPKEHIESSNIVYHDFFKLCNQRHSIRWYDNIDVPIEHVKKAISAALTAPSACNRQPFRFIIVKETKKLAKTVKLPLGCDSYAHNIKLMLIMIGDLSAYFDERDRHLIYIDGGLAAMNLMMALETLGLSSCPINWPDIDEREQLIQREFNLKPYERGIMFFSIGYANDKGGVPFSAKKEVKQVTTIY